MGVIIEDLITTIVQYDIWKNKNERYYKKEGDIAYFQIDASYYTSQMVQGLLLENKDTIIEDVSKFYEFISPLYNTRS